MSFDAYLQIIRTPQIGARTFYKLMQKHNEDAESILDFLKFRGFKVPDLSQIHKERTLTEKIKGSLIFYKDPLYPTLLKTITDPPPFLSIIGDPSLFNEKISIAIVGARNASLNAKRFIEDLSKTLSKNGYCITSGLAKGIDAAAHKGAVDQATIAVMAGGIDQLYPLENLSLYEKIKEKGIIVSEMPFSTAPTGQLFARRNKIISGLSRILIICEAARHSGSLITAEFALEQNRDIFAIPGFPLDPRSEGCHRLIQDGAHLLHNAEDVLSYASTLPDVIPVKEKKNIPFIFKKEEKNKIQNSIQTDDDLLNLLSDKPVLIDDLLNHFSNYSVSDFMIKLFQLEMEGLIVVQNNSSVIKKF